MSEMGTTGFAYIFGLGKWDLGYCVTGNYGHKNGNVKTHFPIQTRTQGF